MKYIWCQEKQYLPVTHLPHFTHQSSTNGSVSSPRIPSVASMYKIILTRSSGCHYYTCLILKNACCPPRENTHVCQPAMNPCLCQMLHSFNHKIVSTA